MSRGETALAAGVAEACHRRHCLERSEGLLSRIPKISADIQISRQALSGLMEKMPWNEEREEGITTAGTDRGGVDIQNPCQALLRLVPFEEIGLLS
jgi:hypothetical protein